MDERYEPGGEMPLDEMLMRQIALSDNIQTTAEMMKFVLSLANENLMAMRGQLQNIRELTARMEDASEGPAPEAEDPGGPY